MLRLLVVFLALLLPIQFAWSAASAYCGHEQGAGEASHVGHHFHTHQGESKSNLAAGKLAADPDCASCQATPTPAIASTPEQRLPLTSGVVAAPMTLRPFTSALARAPDRPQWLRLV